MTHHEKASPRRWLGDVGFEVDRRVRQLWEAAQSSSTARGTLAVLRRSVMAEPGTEPLLWNWTNYPVPEGVGDDPTREERAVHASMTLFAVHQQSQPACVHQEGQGLGAALRRYVYAGGAEEDPAARARFETLVTATTWPELLTHLRSVVGQFRARKIPLDYGMLADDLVTFQRPGGRDIVRRRWSRQYYRITAPATDETSKE